MKNKRLLSVIGTFFKDLFTKNLAIKLIALLFAVLLWGYVLTIENPEYNKIVRDVEITMIGEETLNEKGLMLVSRELGTTDVTVLCQIGKHSELDASRISCVVDLSNRSISLSEDEDVKVLPLPVSTTLQTGYGTIVEVETTTVNVEIARVSTRRNLPVAVEFTGNLPEGFRADLPDRLTISVTGMKSQVEEIARGVVTVDLDAFPTSDPETLAGDYNGVYPVRFYNSSNVGLENIVADNGESYTIEVGLTIRAYKQIEIQPDIRVTDEYSYSMALSRGTVLVYGDRQKLLETDRIGTEPVVGLAGMTAEALTAKLILPEGISLASGESSTVTVTLTVTERIETREYVVPIAVRGMKDNLLRGDDFPTEAMITATGTVRQLDAFSSAYVTLTLDLSGCGAGTNTVALLIDAGPRADNVVVELMDDPTVTVTLVERVEENQTLAIAEPDGEEPEQ